MLLNAFLPLPVFNPALHIVTVNPSAAALSTVGTKNHVTLETSANQPVKTQVGQDQVFCGKKNLWFFFQPCSVIFIKNRKPCNVLFQLIANWATGQAGVNLAPAMEDS